MTVEIDLSGRRALVTGSGQGVGRAVARRLAQAGAAVVVNDIVADRAEAVAAEIRRDGAAADTRVFDLTRWDDVRLRRYVIRRRGDPSDAAAMVTFLASEHAGWVTGQTIPVDGGYSFAL